MDLIESCRLLILPLELGPAFAAALAAQLERLVTYLAEPPERAHIDGPPAVVRSLRSHGGRLPIGLMEAEPDHATFYIALAACAFPEKVQSFAEGELPARRAVFEDALQAGRDGATPEEILLERFPALPEALPGDLTCIERAESPEEREQRRVGGILYLLTLDEERLAATVEFWGNERAVLHHFRRCLPHPPRRIRQAAPAGLCPDSPDELREEEERLQAFVLSALLANPRMPAWPGPAITTALDEVWEAAYDQLLGGFPYFALRAQLATWLYARARRYQPGAALLPPPDEGGGGTGADPHALTESLLHRSCREGHRYTRRGFFPLKVATARLPDGSWQASATGLAPVGPCASEEDAHAAALEEYRVREVDTLLHHAPDLPIWDAPGPVNGQGDAVKRHRLRRRLFGYVLGRYYRMTTAELLSFRPPRTRATDYPMQAQGIRAAAVELAALGRAVPADRSALWAWIAFARLRGRLYPRYRDPWDFPAGSSDFRCWQADALLPGALADGVATGLAPDPELLELLGGSVGGLTAMPAKHFEGSVKGAWDLVVHVCDLADSCAPCLYEWRRLTRPVGYMIIPAWYLHFVEGLDADGIAARLLTNPVERAAVTALAEEWSRVPSCGQRPARPVGGQP